MKLLFTIIALMSIIAWCQSRQREEEEKSKPLVRLLTKQRQYAEWRNRILKPKSKKKILMWSDGEKKWSNTGGNDELLG